MKTLRYILPFLLLSCSTMQQAQFKADAVAATPLVQAGLTAAGGQYGPLAASLYGMAVQAWAGQPAAQGSANPAIASAVTPLLPSSNTQAAALLDAAGAIAAAKAQ